MEDLIDALHKAGLKIPGYIPPEDRQRFIDGCRDAVQKYLDAYTALVPPSGDTDGV